MTIKDKVLILDFGSQLTYSIARRIKDLNIYSEIKPFSTSAEKIYNFNPTAVILSGGNNSVTNSNSPKIPQCIYQLNVPILGICYGQQALCLDFGGTISHSVSRNYGAAELKVLEESLLFQGIWKKGNAYPVWMSHSDCISKLPSTFKVVASTDKAPYAVIQHKTQKIFGIQFHPEVSHTPDGIKILNRFLTKIADCKKNFKMTSFINKKITEIRNTVGKKNVILALSGGVDSTVTAILLRMAIGSQLYCVFIDNGLLRQDEVNEVQRNLKDKLQLQIMYINAGQKFLSSLIGVTDPEIKRKIIGRVFIETFKEVTNQLDDVHYLAQGTIYPDVIESAVTLTEKLVTIKSHHNVGGLPQNMQNLTLIEPLKLLFKDEVKKLGKKLRVPHSILNRHPFPGPGLGIRVIGEVTKEKCDILRKADHIFINTLRNEGYYNKVWQAYAALLPTKAVGVMGDNRTYQHICVLRAVQSVDGMTANCVTLPHKLLCFVANKIINEVNGINRVVYDITSKPPATIEIE